MIDGMGELHALGSYVQRQAKGAKAMEIVVTEEVWVTFGLRQAGKEKGFLVSLDLIPNANSKPVSVPLRDPPVVSSTEPPTPAVLSPRPYFLHPRSMVRLPPRPAVALPPPLTGRSTSLDKAGDGHRQLFLLHKPSLLTSQCLLHLARHKPPINMKPPLHNSPPQSLRVLMEPWSRSRKLSGISTSKTATANVSTLPTVPSTSLPPLSSTLVSAPLLTTTEYIPPGPSATRDLERWPNLTKDLDRAMDMHDRDREREREYERDRDRDRARDSGSDRDEGERYGDRDRERETDRDLNQRHYRRMRRPGWR